MKQLKCTVGEGSLQGNTQFFGITGKKKSCGIFMGESEVSRLIPNTFETPRRQGICLGLQLGVRKCWKGTNRCQPQYSAHFSLFPEECLGLLHTHALTHTYVLKLDISKICSTSIESAASRKFYNVFMGQVGVKICWCENLIRETRCLTIFLFSTYSHFCTISCNLVMNPGMNFLPRVI